MAGNRWIHRHRRRRAVSFGCFCHRHYSGAGNGARMRVLDPRPAGRRRRWRWRVVRHGNGAGVWALTGCTRRHIPQLWPGGIPGEFDAGGGEGRGVGEAGGGATVVLHMSEAKQPQQNSCWNQYLLFDLTLKSSSMYRHYLEIKPCAVRTLNSSNFSSYTEIK